MARSSITAWSVTVEPARGRRKSLYIRARRTVDGKREEIRESSGTTDETEARRLAAGMLARLNGTAVGMDATVLEVLEARIKALELDHDTSPSTLKCYQAARCALVPLPLAAVRASQLGAEHVAAARDVLRAAHSAGTTKQYLGKLAAAWRWAYDPERKLVPIDWPRVRGVKFKPARESRAFTPLEAAKFVAYCHEHEPRWALFFELLAATGARSDEILSRKVEDVDMERCTLRLRSTDTKTGRPREVGFPARLLPLFPERARGVLLFPSPRNPGRHLSDEGARDALNRVLKVIGVQDPKALTKHSLRAAFCADGTRAGVPEADVMRQTGHASKRVFHEHYASKARTDTQRVAETVDAYRQELLAEDQRPVIPTVAPVGITAVHNLRLCPTRGSHPVSRLERADAYYMTEWGRLGWWAVVVGVIEEWLPRDLHPQPSG